MFTGIIEAKGYVKALKPTSGDLRLTIQSPQLDFKDIKLGDSISTNGICLTVIEQGSDWYAADVSAETVRHTTIQHWLNGSQVNLEKAMLPTTRFGGHIVSGHVDGVGTVRSITTDARSIVIWIDVPEALRRYMAHKGSVTVDGISLTINEIDPTGIALNLVPHTVENTNIKHWQARSPVNLEVDVLARYLERLMQAGQNSANNPLESAIDLDLLQRSGFL